MFTLKLRIERDTGLESVEDVFVEFGRDVTVGKLADLVSRESYSGKTIISADAAKGPWARATKLRSTGLLNGDRVRLVAEPIELEASGSAQEPKQPRKVAIYPRRALTSERPSQPVLRLPSPPKFPRPRSDRLATVASLALAGAALYLTIGNVLVLGVFGVLPLVLLTEFTFRKREFLRASDEFEREMSAVTDMAADLKEIQVIDAFARLPSTLDLVEQPDGLDRLWERRASEEEFLNLRLGVGRGLPDLEVGAPRVDNEWDSWLSGRADEIARLPSTPVALQLRQVGSAGIVGDRGMVTDLAKSLILQAAILHSPTELELAALVANPNDWDWLKWLPHASVAAETTWPWSTGAGASDWWHALDVVADRRDGVRQMNEIGSLPHLVVLVDGATAVDRRVLERISGLPDISVMYLAAAVTEVPRDCRAVVEVSNGAAWLDVETGQRTELLVDECPRGECIESVSAWMSPIIDAFNARPVQLPAQLGLMELIEASDLLSDPEQLVVRWREGKGLQAPVGLSSGGTVSIDLEKEGPHGFVTGTSGSGKSEFIDTLATSLALTHSPERVNFIAIDYKRTYPGGIDDFPHFVGRINGLEPRLAERTLVSLEAELARRMRVLQETGFPSVQAMEAARHPEVLPKLLVLVDEAGHLANELPDFIDGLSQVARRGRSLGIHMLLASQTASRLPRSLFANTNLRVAFRSADIHDSLEVIDVPGAATIDSSTPGRFLMRKAQSEPQLVQCAYVNASADDDYGPSRLRVWPLVLNMAGTGLRVKPLRDQQDRDDLSSQPLVARVAAVANASSERLRLGEQHRPILPPLPDSIYFDQLAGILDGQLVPFGLEDDLVNQRYAPTGLDLSADDQVVAIGGAGSGKTALLSTLAASAARSHDPGDLHLYVVGSGHDEALEWTTRLPHSGGFAKGSDLTAATRILDRVLGVSEARAASAARRASRSQPTVLLMIDDLGDLEDRLSATPSHNVDPVAVVRQIIREAGGSGVHVVATDSGSTSLSRVWLERIRHLLLPGSQQTRLSFPASAFPPRGSAPGSGVWAESGQAVQVARSPDPATLEKLVRTAEARAEGVPKDRLPAPVGTSSAIAERFHPADATGVPIGRDLELAVLLGKQVTTGSVAIVGPRRAGKTWLARDVARRMRASGYSNVFESIVADRSDIDSPDALAALLVGDPAVTADELSSRVRLAQGTSSEYTFLLDEVGRLGLYAPEAVSWLRDLGQAGAWMIYSGTAKDWELARRRALERPGSSFGNDVHILTLGAWPIDVAREFLGGTSASMGLRLAPKLVEHVIDIVGTWPFYLQVVGDALVRSETSSMALEAIHDFVVHELIDQWTGQFHARWSEIDSAARQALLQRPGSWPSNPSRLQREQLRLAGLLGPGEVPLVDKPFFNWIDRNRHALRDEEGIAT